MAEINTDQFKQMFDCDTARISAAGGKLFLIIGTKRNTRDDPGQWYENGQPRHFDYVAEKVVASGETEAELMASAQEYKRLQGMTWQAYFEKLLADSKPCPPEFAKVVNEHFWELYQPV